MLFLCAHTRVALRSKNSSSVMVPRSFSALTLFLFTKQFVSTRYLWLRGCMNLVFKRVSFHLINSCSGCGANLNPNVCDRHTSPYGHAPRLWRLIALIVHSYHLHARSVPSHPHIDVSTALCAYKTIDPVPIHASHFQHLGSLPHGLHVGRIEVIWF